MQYRFVTGPAAALLALALALHGAAQAAPQELREALRSEAGRPAVAATLPDELVAGEGRAEPLAAHYRLEFVTDATTQEQALYLPGLIAHARIAVNGHVLHDTLERVGQPLPRSLQRIRWLRVPDEFLHAGANELTIDAGALRFLSVSPVWVGPADELERRYDDRVFGAVIGPALVATTIVCLALSVLVLWARRRHETLYGYFGVGALCWGLHSAWSVLPAPLLGGVHQAVWWTALYSFFVMLLVIFCVRFAGWRWPRFDRALWTLALAAPAVLYAADAAGVFGAVAEAWRAGCIAIVAVAVAAVGVHAWRRRDVGSALLLASGVVSLAFGARDWQVAHQGLDNNPVYLTPYAGLLFIALVAWMLVDGFVEARRALEAANAGLEERVAHKSAELGRALDAMRDARDAAEAADRAKSRFLAVASHDLRQPVHALGLYLASIPAQAQPAPVRDTLQRMGASVTALDSMFDALLDLTRMDAGAVVPRPAPFDLAALLRRLGDEFAPLAERRGLRLLLHGRDDGAQALADPLLVERIVRNLLGNALKYTHEGGVLLSWRWRGPPPGRWRVEVWDTGCGIAPAEQARVFDEFHQVRRSGPGGEGLGLGLAIVRRLARLMGLPIALHSVPGRGTRFELILPATPEAPAPALPGTAAPLAAGRWIALVEDDLQVRTAMRRLLEHWQCRAVEGDGADALLLDWHRAGRPPVAAIVADLQLGAGGCGLAAIERLRDAWARDGLPALVVTGESSPERIGALESAGIPWLAKPVPPARLRSWLAEALRSRPQTDEATA